MSDFRPDYAFDHVSDINPEWLAELGVEGLLIDIDNTLTAWESHDVPEEMHTWLRELKKGDLPFYFLSNGLSKKLRAVEQQTGVECITGGLKPFPSFFRAGLDRLALPPEKVAMVGDMVVTDVYGGNRMGMVTILVEPLSPVDFPVSKIFRLMETWFNWREPKLDPETTPVTGERA